LTLEDKALAVTKLYANKEFQELILGTFIDEGIHSLVLTENVASEAIQDELKARKILYDWLYVIIEEAEIAKTENKE
jgi:hypothetical protein